MLSEFRKHDMRRNYVGVEPERARLAPLKTRNCAFRNTILKIWKYLRERERQKKTNKKEINSPK